MFKFNQTLFICVLSLLFITLAGVALSADITVLVDNAPMKRAEELEAHEKAETSFYLDTSPEVLAGRVFVPLRVLADMLGFKVNYEEGMVQLTNDETTVSLTVGSRQFIQNGQTMTLDTAPLVKNNRLLVPLRYIAEWFGCTVDYDAGKVNLRTEPLFIDGQKVTSLRIDSPMTMGGKVYLYTNNLLIKAVYESTQSLEWHEVAEPPSYGLPLSEPDCYGKPNTYEFVNADGKVLRAVDVYKISFWPPSPPEGYTAQLIYDKAAAKWYLMSDEAWGKQQSWFYAFDGELIENAESNEFLQSIFYVNADGNYIDFFCKFGRF